MKVDMLVPLRDLRQVEPHPNAVGNTNQAFSRLAEHGNRATSVYHLSKSLHEKLGWSVCVEECQRTASDHYTQIVFSRVAINRLAAIVAALGARETVRGNGVGTDEVEVFYTEASRVGQTIERLGSLADLIREAGL